jgi:hypothetical protein
MHEKKMESILNRLSKIIDNAPRSLPDKDSVNWRSFGRDEINFYLIGDNLDTYNNLLEDLLVKEKWGEKFSEEYVDKVLQDGSFNILKYGIEKAREYFVKTCSELETYSTKQIVYIPLGGVEMHDVENFSLGRIQFKRITKTILEEILEATQTILRKTRHSPEEQELFIQESNENLSKEFSGKICAVYQIVAEQTRARELAEQETQLALDLLRYSIPALYRDSSIIRIGLSSQASFIYQPTLTLSSASFVPNRRLLNRNYEISPNNIAVLREIGVFEVSDILRKPYEQLNDFEKTLLRGIHWFADSQTQVKVENQFLNLVTCLEVFFTPDKGDPISNSIAEGTALVLGNDLNERKRLKKRVKELYGLRSKVSHGGHSSILNKDVFDLKFIAMKLLVKMIKWRETFKNRKNLIDWLEDQRLS